MANYQAPDTEFQAVANAIRTKGGTQAQLEWPSGFVSAVEAIPTGSSPVLKNETFTENGQYTAGQGYDGFGTVTVNVSGGGGSSMGKADVSIPGGAKEEITITVEEKLS